ncbi:MAG: glycosyltransferase family 4 protein, partial [Verrucomicrobia bacterium]|nr:glycosyltransferase family 4 protein [Verrucomicrobiota bacterium]
VSAAWETHVIAPGEHFWDFSELPAFDYNHIFVREALKKLGDRTPSFIYQRYSHNNYSGMKLAKHYQVPFVLEFNGSEIWIARNWGNPLKYETVSEHIETANLAAAQLIVVVSQPLKDDLVRKGIAEDKILVNPNGVDPDRYSPDIDGSELRKTWQIEHKTVIGFIGTFGRWHGAEILAEAYGKLLQTYPEYRDKVRLLMIGEGTTLPQVKQTLQKWNVVNSCILTGAIPQTEGPAYLAACDLLVSPQVPNRDGTPFFGSPTKLFEYMAMGKGIVASDLDQIGEILEHNESALLTKPGDAGGLMLALKTLIDDPQMRDRLGRAARKKVIDHYSWKEHTRKIVSRLREKFSH